MVTDNKLTKYIDWHYSDDQNTLIKALYDDSDILLSLDTIGWGTDKFRVFVYPINIVGVERIYSLFNADHIAKCKWHMVEEDGGGYKVTDVFDLFVDFKALIRHFGYDCTFKSKE